MYHPFDNCERLNTFAVVEKEEHFATDNLGATYQDYLKNLFWSRSWVLKGANPSQLSKQYGILAIERLVSTRLKADKASAKRNSGYFVNILQLDDCETCPSGCNRTKEEIHQSNLNLAEIVISEIYNTELYNIVENNKEPYTAWLIGGYADFLKTVQGVSLVNPTGHKLSQYLINKEFILYKTEIKGIDLDTCITFEISFEVCRTVEVERDFTQITDNPKSGVVICQC